MSKTLTLRLDDDSYRLLADAAQAENRSIANLIQTAAIAHVREQVFVDDYEMAAIRSDEALVERLREGSRDAREGRGRYVD
ncbi:MAG TPA: CopG family transcriptional regulator [Thermoanaerobaculia bacterium]|nr:CopG family transcriptional regulator [Thermoanaerobaculia bacterium]